ncbi:ribitol 5-phosphate transferase FKRP [Parasteatoda tepidariorum]|uniref:ribitol 5-phosphate transferase FKRP n=1 Tax=Parasteatoda tepidariorum TaxID=114398 RepID=UPI00077F8A0D|nr:fukutin-related protein [Parasteatoda tepidariorum]
MRVIPWRVFMIGAVFTNIIIAGIMWSYLDCDCSKPDKIYTSYIRDVHKEHGFEKNNINYTELQLASEIIIVIRDFELFENDLPNTTKSISTILPAVKILLITDKIIYPPLKFDDHVKDNVQIINLKSSLSKPQHISLPMNYIDKNHVFIFPDAVHLDSQSQLSQMLELHSKYPNKIIAAPIEDSLSECLSLNISLRYWTLKYSRNSKKSDCGALEGQHVFLVTKSLLVQLGFPFSRPFSTSLFIQAALFKIEIKLVKDFAFKKRKTLFSDEHSKMKHDTLEMQRKQILYEEFGIKKIIFPASKVEWHGCNKKTARCFGTIVDNMPEYLYEGRWTPPCCIENLRVTTRYVIGILEKCRVRYWLEGGSLLGAVRTGDIIPWDYDVDIGMYKEDIQKCEWLKNTQKQSFVDTQGFLWEKATEGDFIRVQFSATNHLHVDLFPFYSRNGTMTKDTWFVDHKQDMEFPEHYLKPFYTIKFVGITASAPNNYREFLELKFGKGSIENPEYPDPTKLKFSRRN